ncbi:MAG: hypothetical protein ISR65_07140 [Bacteriovoracaceae bacterium]|nr:hypothetical protein [Bacteriovoracaceae bacterium]
MATADSGTSPSKSVDTVPKVQYEQLLSKYEKLERRVRKMDAQNKSGDDQHWQDPSIILNEIDVKKNTPKLAETVDVFGKNEIATATPAQANPAKNVKVDKVSPKIDLYEVTNTNLENEIVQLSKAHKLADLKKYDATISVLKSLETSKNMQVRVRTKYLLGEVLFIQKEYDLAMQVFEEIIREYAFSGLVLKTLEQLIVCSDKLKLMKKKKQYSSILSDFFGQQVRNNI